MRERRSANRISGAVHCGLEGNQVDSRKARSHYGIHRGKTFDPAIHQGKSPQWNNLEEKWFVYNLMKWYITKVSVSHSLFSTHELS